MFRFQIHSDSSKLEISRRQEIFSRIETALQQTKDGRLTWLLGSRVTPPYLNNGQEGRPVGIGAKIAESRSLLGAKTISDKASSSDKDTLNREDGDSVAIGDFYLLPDKALEFLSDAFDELEKCRCLLRWSYPFCLFDLEDVLRHHKALKSYRNFPFLSADFSIHGLENSNSNSSDTASRGSPAGRVVFNILQSLLEFQTEQLSDLLSRSRVRFTRELLKQAVQDARNARLDFEAILESTEDSKEVLLSLHMDVPSPFRDSTADNAK